MGNKTLSRKLTNIKDNMKQTMNEFDFKNEFKKIRPNNFSYDGLTVLYDYLIQYEEDCDTELEFDPIAYCCEYTEFDSFKDVQVNYDVKTLKELEDKTTVLKIPNSEKLIVQNY